jgi:hypothetical protein
VMVAHHMRSDRSAVLLQTWWWTRRVLARIEFKHAPHECLASVDKPLRRRGSVPC